MPPFSTPLTGDRDAKPGHLVVHGKKTRYVESNLCTLQSRHACLYSTQRNTATRHHLLISSSGKVVSAEASQDALESSSDEDEGHDNTNRPTGDVGGGLVLGFTEADERNIIHPDAATILRLWQIFLDNCNPVKFYTCVLLCISCKLIILAETIRSSTSFMLQPSSPRSYPL